MKPLVRSNHFVTQYLENISRTAMKKHVPIIKEFIRRRRGIYVMYRGDRLYYVGLASNLLTRLNTHLKDRHRDSWDRFSVYLTISDAHLRELESLILRTMQPKGNNQKGKFSKAQDLRRGFEKRVKEQQSLERAALFGAPVDREENSAAGPDRSYRLRARYKGKAYGAQWRRDGRIRYKGKLYDSPSAAGTAVRNRQTNGWHFWFYERAPGDWVRIKELRK